MLTLVPHPTMSAGGMVALIEGRVCPKQHVDHADCVHSTLIFYTTFGSSMGTDIY